MISPSCAGRWRSAPAMLAGQSESMKSCRLWKTKPLHVSELSSTGAILRRNPARHQIVLPQVELPLRRKKSERCASSSKSSTSSAGQVNLSQIRSASCNPKNRTLGTASKMGEPRKWVVSFWLPSANQNGIHHFEKLTLFVLRLVLATRALLFTTLLSPTLNVPDRIGIIDHSPQREQ